MKASKAKSLADLPMPARLSSGTGSPEGDEGEEPEVTGGEVKDKKKKKKPVDPDYVGADEPAEGYSGDIN